MDFKTFERTTRDKSYAKNLVKEDRITKVYLAYLTAKGIEYIVNPTDSEKNKLGSDITVFNGRKYEIDLKGCENKYSTVCLSYERSYDGKTWYSTIENRITSAYVFIDEWNNIYSISKAEIFANFDKYKKTEVNPETGGHHQKSILIPKWELHYLGSYN